MNAPYLSLQKIFLSIAFFSIISFTDATGQSTSLTFSSSGTPAQSISYSLSHDGRFNSYNQNGSWIRFYDDNQGNIVFTCDVNSGSSDRTGDVTFYFSSYTHVVTILQEGTCPTPSAPGVAGVSNYCQTSTAEVSVQYLIPDITSYDWYVYGGTVTSYVGAKKAKANIKFGTSNVATIRVRAVNSCGASEYSEKTVELVPYPSGSISSNYSTVNCTNPTATLTAPVGELYLWSTGATTASINVSPISQTDYSVTVRNGNACSTTFTKTIYADKPLPLSTMTATRTTVNCTNPSTTLSVPSAAGNTYLWNTGATSSSITVSPATTSTYTVTITGSNGCSVSTSQVITNNQTNTAITTQPANKEKVEGHTAQFHVNAVGEGTVSYQWEYSTNGGATYSTISGAISSRYTTPILNPSYDNYRYRCKVTGTCNTVTSIAAILSVYTNPNITPTPYAPPTPSSNNYVHSITPLVALQQNDFENALAGDATTISNKGLKIGDISHVINYFDGLGRATQRVDYRNSHLGRDEIQPIAYDKYGREINKYLPYTSGFSGAYKPTAINDQASFYNIENDKIENDINPYAVTVFDNSPFNRVLQQGAPGSVWQPNDLNDFLNNKTIKYQYKTNTANDVIIWNYSYPTATHPMGSCSFGGYYTLNPSIINSTIKEGQLFVTEIYDEHNNKIVEFKDKEGRIVLKRVMLGTVPAETYYVYDDIGNLRIVLPPEAVKAIKGAGNTVTQADLTKWAFCYNYDTYQRMVEKKVPGTEGPVFMIYDNRDRLALTQDANQRASNEWLFTKYDHLNRPVLTGKFISAGTRATVQIMVDDFYDKPSNKYYEDRGMVVHGYTNRSFPTENISEYLSVSYYDNYTFRDDLPGFGASYAYDPDQLGCKTTQVEYCFPEAENQRVKGQVTGSKVKVLGENIWLNSVNYYDDHYRNIQTVSGNYFGKIDILSSLYDFTGKVLKTLLVHNSNTQSSLKVHNEFVYDHAGRLMETYQQIGDDPADKILLASNDYNEIGELVRKNLHGTKNNEFIQSVDYRYNIRGWLIRINNSDLSPDAGQDKEDYFGMRLFYNYGFDKPQYNGNISGVRWKSKVDNTEKAYGYVYDNMNRITGADYIAGGSGNWTKEAERFEVSNITYDLNGNIQTLHRNGLFRKQPGKLAEYGVVDRLDYQYKGNQLMAVNDAITTPSARKGEFKDNGSKGSLASPEYGYDDNGNMITDGNKGITVDYNHLNLPKKVDFGSGKYIEYIYDAAGVKLAQKVYQNNTSVKETIYNGGFIYENDILQFLQTVEGRVVADRDYDGNFEGWEYQYHLKDHLGNVRLTFTTAKEEMSFEATMESEYAAIEEVMYSNLTETRHTDLNGNHTVDGSITANEAASLNGTDPNRMVGPAIVLPVYPGDMVKMEVFASYMEGTGNNTSKISLATLTTAVAGAFGGSIDGTEQAKVIYNAIEDALLLAGGAAGDPNTDVPRTFMNYLLFDRNMVPLTPEEGGFGYIAITEEAKQITGPTHEKLEFEPLLIDKEGFIYVYLSNESSVDINVLFDDMKVTLVESPIVQADDYYPGGLTFNSYKRSYSAAQNYLYQGKELQPELATYDFHARMYDPAIVRTFQTDPMSELFYDHSPYSWLKNNLITRIDPTGMTDFKFNKKTGEITQVGDANDDPDRILKTNRKGEVKYKKNGEAKVALGGIEQGILADGQNWKTDDQIIDVGGEGQASLEGVEDFVTRFSEHVGVEFSGAYLSQEDKADATISKVYVDEYEGNKPKQSSATFTKLFTDPSLKGFNTITDFHTHPSNIGVSRTDVERPSGTTGQGGDLKHRDNQRSYFYNFLILTRTATYPSQVQRINYTNWKK